MTADQDYQSPDSDLQDLDQMLYARHVEVESFKDLENQRGTNIPALFNTFYKFIHNPSSVSVETFKRMVDTDDTIGSGVDFLTTCLAARLGKYYHKNPEITEWVQGRLNEIKGGWTSTLKQLLSATWAGFAVAEKVWANTEKGFVPQKVVVLPPSTILFEAERTGELTPDGILQYQRNWNPLSLGLGIGYYGGALSVGMGFTGSSAQPDPFAKFGDLPFPMRTANSYNYLCIRIPTQKCIHYAFDAQGSFGNHYGRALTLDTPILTLDGWKNMEMLKIGDYLFDEKGKICKVIEKSEIWEDRPTYRIKFSDGTTIDADENHIWLMQNQIERKIDSDGTHLRTKDIYEIITNGSSKENILTIKIPEALKLPKKKLIIHPYVLGLWLGDGNKDSAQITTHMDDIEEIKSYVNIAGYETGETKNNGKEGNKGRIFRIFSDFQTQLRIYGLLNNKHIPEEYLTGSIEQRLELMQGLLDSDGFITKAGYELNDGTITYGGNISFTNTNYNLIENVATLVRSLGIACTIGPKKRGWGTKWKQDAWEVRFTPVGVDCFKLKRKLEKQLKTENKRHKYIYVRSIEKIENQKTVCIEVDSESHLFLAGEGLTPTHNSLLRRAYKWWVQKDTYCRMMSVALDRKGTPLTIIYASQHTTLQDTTKVSSTDTNQRGVRNIGIRADVAAQQAFTNVHNDTFVVLPGKKGEIFDTDFVPQDAHADQFMQAIDMCNKSMLRSLLIPSLIFGNGDGSGSFALGQEHAKTFLQILDGELQGLQEVLKEQLIREMLTYNFPEEMWKADGVGEFANRDFSQEEQDKIVTMYDKAITAGIVDVNDLEDLNRMRTTIGFTERDTPIEKVNMDGDFANTELNSTSNIEYDNDGNILPTPNDNQPVEQNDLADLALNGAQVSALLEVISNVVTGLLPQSSAIEIIHAAFPLIDIERIKRIIGPIKVDKSIVQQPKKDKKNGNNSTDK
jgi:hypothetical protein